MKTPEELAEEYGNTIHKDQDGFNLKYCRWAHITEWEKRAFLAGYAAAQTNLPTPAKWISVKERLPEVGVLCAWISHTTQSCIERIEVDDMHPWYEGFDYWCELPLPPKENE